MRISDWSSDVCSSDLNLELMRDPETGEPHTAHTVGPVPLVYVGRAARLRSGGALRDLAPSVLRLMGLHQQAEIRGRMLVELVSVCREMEILGTSGVAQQS